MALLGERHSLYVWAALALMLVGLALVRPRERPA
jgi:drug/metabolite transporter (DMT)-like permease